ncbi:MAG: ankyrin repeat domain-containing protein [Candidatus Babeliales bacterium]|jgi:hypothetical protein
MMNFTQRLGYVCALFFCGLAVINTNHLDAALTPPVAPVSKVILNGFQCSIGSDCIISSEDVAGMFSKLIEQKVSIGDENWLRDFVKHNGVEWRDEAGRTLLHYAVISNKFQLVKLLIEESKHPINVFDQFGLTPLDYSKEANFEYLMDECILRLSLFCEHPWDCRDVLSKESLLSIACMHVSDKYIRILVSSPYNAKINDEMITHFTVGYGLTQDGEKRDKLLETHSFLQGKYAEQKRKIGSFCNIQ